MCVLPAPMTLLCVASSRRDGLPVASGRCAATVSAWPGLGMGDRDDSIPAAVCSESSDEGAAVRVLLARPSYGRCSEIRDASHTRTSAHWQWPWLPWLPTVVSGCLPAAAAATRSPV